MKITVHEKNFLCSYTIADAHGEFEMADADVETLVALIREKGTTDIDELGVYNSHPAIYKLLREEINSIRYDSACDHEMREAIFNAECEWDVDTDELIDYCRQNCGFKDSYFDEKNEETHKIKEEQFYDRFWAWYHDYVDTAPFEEIHNLFYELYDTEYEYSGLGFEYYEDYYPFIFIPQQIINLANLKK
jgi:hypothetical protein